MTQLENKIAIVTGASRGIGAAIAAPLPLKVLQSSSITPAMPLRPRSLPARSRQRAAAP
jgi:hypothetical protein